MPPSLKQYLNRTILISIPALFEDGRCREYILQSIEPDGLWLNSESLASRLLPEDGPKTTRVKPVAFVPDAQIAAIILPPISAAVKVVATTTANAAAAVATKSTKARAGKTARAEAAASAQTTPIAEPKPAP
jgi:hypothetical protein